jgi:hypothetical protein
MDADADGIEIEADGLDSVPLVPPVIPAEARGRRRGRRRRRSATSAALADPALLPAVPESAAGPG